MADSSNTIGSGTVAGALEYLNFLANKGHLTTGSVRALKTGFTQVTKTLGGNDWEKIEVRSIDVDDYMVRFANMTHGKYGAASLADYKSRVRKVVTWYLKFLSNPGWAPDVKARTRRSSKDAPETTATTDIKPKKSAQVTPEQTPTETPMQPTTLSKLVAFPFPLADGTLANLYLPANITSQDAKRMARFIETLVIEDARNEE